MTGERGKPQVLSPPQFLKLKTMLIISLNRTHAELQDDCIALALYL